MGVTLVGLIHERSISYRRAQQNETFHPIEINFLPLYCCFVEILPVQKIIGTKEESIFTLWLE